MIQEQDHRHNDLALSHQALAGSDLFVHLASITSDTQRDVADLFERLSILPMNARHNSDSVIADILKLIAESLDVGVTSLARVDGASLHIERAYDRAGMGLHSGATLALRDTYCSVMLSGSLRSLVVEDAAADARFAALPTTAHFGIKAYSGVPLHNSQGTLYGTLCTLHPRARSIQPGEIAVLTLAGRMIINEVEAEALRARERQLTTEVTASEERLRTVYAAIGCGVLMVDAGGHIIEANTAAQQILGLSAAELRRYGLLEAVTQACHADGTDLPREERPITVALRSGRPVHDAVMGITRLDGRQRWLHIDAVPILDGAGLVAYLVVSIIDITERKHAEEAIHESHRELERSNTELQQFAYVASHDLQEPLRMVSSYMQLLSRRYKGKLDADADEFIGYAVDGATRMQTLINDLLVYSRVGTSAQELARVDCGAVVATALANLSASIAERDARITLGALPVVRADEVQLSQLFQNLIGNALKFCHQTPQIAITAALADGEWRLTVRDNGIGIDPAYVERIFVIFQRLHTREEYAGTGIGLAICKKIVERHGGRIWVASQPGRGAAFTFTLPAMLETGDQAI